MNYKTTINLPTTSFPQKAGLTEREPKFREKWDSMSLYEKIQKLRAGSKKYILHDGPPYASGELHIGTGMNKILKDLVVKYKTMRGFHAPYIPGWDCHGLPIEHKVMTELGQKFRTMSKADVRERCQEYALKFVKRQKFQFKALGVFGDWENPYLTINYDYEAGIIDAFSKLIGNGLVSRSLKPIHWCMSCETALAEAELEYANKHDESIFVEFTLKSDVRGLYPTASEDVKFLVWTTTPWTLPANVAIAVNRRFKYACVRFTRPDGEKRDAILAEDLVENVMKTGGITDFEILGTALGADLEKLEFQHVFIKERTGIVIIAEYVSLEDGTGLVHIAPGHGKEDYESSLQYKLPVLSPVDSSGSFTKEAGQFEGMNVFAANKEINEHLESLKAMFHKQRYEHSYPHCWRCHKPVIFRATEQWFVNVDQNDLRSRALKEIEKTNWVPQWGEIRIRNMVADRPDWCISRQRSWGVPIPAYYCNGCGHVHLTQKTAEHVRDYFAEHGSNSWFTDDVNKLLPAGEKCPKCGKSDFKKENDIFDVWFESGSSFRSVCIARPELEFPADLYLEGSDQHRGWFQLSLLTAVGGWGQAPFKTVLTHGFVVDEKGEKMSKSRGNFISVEDALKEFGGDLTRLWVASVDYQADINVSRGLISRMSQQYRKIRNTFRYLLGNLSDFTPDRAVPYGNLEELDRWALSRLQALVEAVTNAFDEFEFHRVYRDIHNFCVVEMSSFYLDVLKDRLYCARSDSAERLSAQTAMHEILVTLTKLIAPITAHTADEIWWEYLQTEAGKAQADQSESIHMVDWPEPRSEWRNTELEQRWTQLIKVRGEISRQLEPLRVAKTIGSSQEATVTVWSEDAELLTLLRSYRDMLTDIFIVSECRIEEGNGQSKGAVQGVDYQAVYIQPEKSTYQKCQRCWNLRSSVGENKEHVTLCARCASAVQGMDIGE